ncbi:helix-turn-helix domain-containing protein [Streptomyces sp. HNM0574]|uniref:TetR/AcrR family transcriptional regulator n=1 Tax=Streptomyces sp. HNM0574 TaxID=2714954 RepID=UPI00146E3D7A|nr:helix-turn-helix domain-containing protein [Streptomyces sp. HNM0574]NLU68416.1 helix-turn-helix transcriptional regulator [Streptomyces sp. HNM0574]
MHIQGIQHTTRPHAEAAVDPAAGGTRSGADTVPEGAAAFTERAATGVLPGQATDGPVAAGVEEGERPAPTRVDAKRNLEHVLRAAREVFGELGYGAPMEDVARRARVGVGTVYRRFPSKDVLVRRIAREETARLAEQAQAALDQEADPWSALARFLRTSAASGAGRLLPPPILRAEPWGDGAPDGTGGTGGTGAVSGRAEDEGVRVPQQRHVAAEGAARGEVSGRAGQPGPGEPRLVGQRPAPDAERLPGTPSVPAEDDSGSAELLGLVGELVQRARDAGELREDVTVRDVLLVLATAAPPLPDAGQQAAASRRLLELLLEGLRPRAAR